MESRGFYNEILTEHNLRPEFAFLRKSITLPTCNF